MAALNSDHYRQASLYYLYFDSAEDVHVLASVSFDGHLSTMYPQAIRLSVSSESASSRHPILVVVRQSRGVSSWAIPYVESG